MLSSRRVTIRKRWEEAILRYVVRDRPVNVLFDLSYYMARRVTLRVSVKRGPVMMPSEWNIQTSDLPGYAPPEWWRGPDMDLFEVTGAPLAFAVYNQREIGIATVAGNFAVFRD